MDKYINYKDIQECRFFQDERGEWIFHTDIIKIPAADVIPIRHGKWIVKGDAQPISNDKIYGCSLCDDKNRRYYKWQLSNYCPNCGALMDKDDNEE